MTYGPRSVLSFVALPVTVLALAGCSTDEITGKDCITLVSGAELCGQDAKDSCHDQLKDFNASRRQERADLRDSIQQARKDAPDLGQTPAQAEKQARKDFEPEQITASEKRSNKLCRDIIAK